MSVSKRRLRSTWASAQSDQSIHCTQWVAKDPRFLHADSEDSDQTGRMPRLIWVFAGHTCHFVGFVMRQLTLLYSKSTVQVLRVITAMFLGVQIFWIFTVFIKMLRKCYRILQFTNRRKSIVLESSKKKKRKKKTLNQTD